MAETHQQINHDGTIATRKTVLWPSTKTEQKAVIQTIFNQKNWQVLSVENQSGSFWKVKTGCLSKNWNINLYISSIRDESRQPDEYKMQLGTSYPVNEEAGWLTVVLGIYTIDDGNGSPDYILSGYDWKGYDFAGNPSLRGTRTIGLQRAYLTGMCQIDSVILFRPEFIYYYLDLIDGAKNHQIPVQQQSNELKEVSDYRQFITAIRTKPFLLLAGISGTGKSRIVRELARACWDADSEEFKAQKPRNFEMVQVKPNWHDSSELIGYVSRVSGQPIFVTGDFLKFVARAWEEPEVPYFLCLDEMNLAPVEQYFAEYLSVIESRKATNGEVGTDPILKPVYKKERDPKTGEIVPEDWYSELISTLLAGCSEEKVFALTKQFESDGISIPQNLIVVGTVNMDETTFSFSRKVLDRAMTIEMNEVDLSGGLTNRYEQIGKLGMNELVGKAVEGVDVYENYEGVCNIAINYLKSINDVLEGTPFKVAYRTRNEVLLYVVNNLPYNKNAEGEELHEEYVIARALDEITNMKVLSRIEGDETKVSNAFLEKLEKAIKQGLENIFEGPFEKEETDDAFKSVSLAKLDEMKKRLSSGYTSFWS